MIQSVCLGGFTKYTGPAVEAAEKERFSLPLSYHRRLTGGGYSITPISSSAEQAAEKCAEAPSKALDTVFQHGTLAESCGPAEPQTYFSADF
jgi:hypothetical protein